MKKVYYWIKQKAIDLLSLVVLTLIAAAIDAGLFIGIPIIYDEYLGKTAIHTKVKQIYQQIVVASGQSNNTVPLEIVESPLDNAYTNGNEIVIYTGLINKSTWDGIAYTLGHELAHHQLMHTRDEEFSKSIQSMEKAEALADKLGAFYIMKAGYDICEARKEWRIERDTHGNYLGETHPNYSYRYDELNINCGEN